MEPEYNAAPQQPQQPQRPRTDGSDINQMVVLQPGERIVCQIKRHPIGLLGQYFISGVIVVVAIAAALFVGPQVGSQSSTAVESLLYVGVGILALIVLLFLGIANSIYWKNRWIVTTDSLTQILQPSLFGQQSSQLSLDDLEDVTVEQQGMMQTMFNYGTLRAETAGERSKFVFPFCPSPKYYARQILVAREDFMNGKRYTQEPRPRPQYEQGQYQQQGQSQPYQGEQVPYQQEQNQDRQYRQNPPEGEGPYYSPEQRP